MGHMRGLSNGEMTSLCFDQLMSSGVADCESAAEIGCDLVVAADEFPYSPVTRSDRLAMSSRLA